MTFVIYMVCCDGGRMDREAVTAPCSEAELLHAHHSCGYASTSAKAGNSWILINAAFSSSRYDLVVGVGKGWDGDRETGEVVVRSLGVNVLYATPR